MNLETLRENIPGAARDIKLNLGTIMSEDGTPDLSQLQSSVIALACAYATKNEQVAIAIEAETGQILDDKHRVAARTAASVMAMNNVYYRFMHLSLDEDLKKLPARLRMNGLANHGIEKLDFEFMALAVSAINGCGMCIESHIHQVRKHGASDLAIQSCARIAAVMSATAQALSLPK